MKKKAVIGLSAILAMSSFTPPVFADGVAEEEQIEESAPQGEILDDGQEGTNDASEVESEEATDDEESSEEPEEEIERVDSLTLEEAIDYGVNSNFSLLKLEIQLKNLKSQFEASIEDHEYLLDDHRDLLNDIEDLEDDMDDLRDLQRETGERTFQQRYQIQQALEELEDGLEALEDSIDGAIDGTENLNSSQIVSELTNQQTEETMKFQIASTYIQQFIQKEQIDLQKESLKTQKQQVKNLERQYEIGVISRNEVDTAKREIITLETQIEDAQESLQKDLALFALDLGIAYHPDLTLISPDLSGLELIEQETKTKELIENLYSMKIAEENIELARYNRDRTYEKYEEEVAEREEENEDQELEDLDEHDLEQADNEVELKLIEMAETKLNAEKAIKELYLNIRIQYNALQDAEREITYAKEDFKNLKKRYNAGVISRQEYELAEINITQANSMLEMEKYNYFLLTNQTELLEAGVILSN